MRKAAFLLALAVAACASRVQADEILVFNVEELKTAMASAHPGQTILITPGIYKGSFSMRAPAGGTAEEPVIIRASEGLGTVTLDGTGRQITLKFSGIGHVIVKDLVITGGKFHGVFFDRAAHDITIENNRIHDNTGKHPLDSHAEIKGSGGDDATRPARITIRGNEIFHTSHPPGGNFQGIDCNRCDDFHIIGNHIHDISQPTGRVYSYYDQGACIQMKTRSIGTIIERNRIERCHIGIVYGGEGAESPEHIGGAVRNNLILNSENIGLVVANVADGKVHNNTFIGNYRDLLLGSDRRHPTMVNDVEIANNIFERPPEELVFKEAVLKDNVVLEAGDVNTLFVDPENEVFLPTAGATKLHGKGILRDGW